MTDAGLESLAIANPAELLRLLTSGELPTRCLPAAAEIAGGIEDHDVEVLEALRELSKHPSADVRRGVVYGCQRLHTYDAFTLVYRLSRKDPDIDVREAAREAIA